MVLAINSDGRSEMLDALLKFASRECCIALGLCDERGSVSSLPIKRQPMPCERSEENLVHD